ncbi:hypothetical protein ACVMB3_004284 [Sinorhizobium meliloti]
MTNGANNTSIIIDNLATTDSFLHRPGEPCSDISAVPISIEQVVRLIK